MGYWLKIHSFKPSTKELHQVRLHQKKFISSPRIDRWELISLEGVDDHDEECIFGSPVILISNKDDNW